MRKRALLMSVVICAFLFLLASPTSALFKSDVKKAKEFMAAGMYPQAIALLEKRINDKPTDAEAHFQLGICYINTGNYTGADERFASAVKLKPAYGYKIGGEYKRVADFYLAKRNLSKAKTLFEKAIDYDPSNRTIIAQELFVKGKQGYDDLFDLVVLYNSGLRGKIIDYYQDMIDKSESETKLYALKKAYQFSHDIKYKEEIAQVYAEKGDLKSLEEACKYSKKYCQQYKLKLSKKRLASSIESYKKRMGAPTRIEELNEDKWITILADPKVGDKIYTLSLRDFWMKDRGGTQKCGAAIKKIRFFEYGRGDINGPLKIKRGSTNTIVYIWIKRKAR